MGQESLAPPLPLIGDFVSVVSCPDNRASGRQPVSHFLCCVRTYHFARKASDTLECIQSILNACAASACFEFSVGVLDDLNLAPHVKHPPHAFPLLPVTAATETA